MIKLFQPFISNEARENVQRVLSGTQIAEGPEVHMFETEFAHTFGFEPWQIVSLNSGTSALELAYELVKICDKFGDPSHRDEVITPVLTCTATNIPLERRHAKIVWADVEGSRSLNVDPDDVYFKLTEQTKAVVFVHFGGSSEGLARIEQVCQDANVDLICDAAQALGAKLSRKARFSCVSLQAIKSLTAGDGGVLICRDKTDAHFARKLRWFGYDRELKQKLGDTDLDLPGYKMHMNDISAAIARGNLQSWKYIVSHREVINGIYRNRGQGKGFVYGIWNPCVVGMDYETAKAKLAAIDVEIGQYHYPNNKYTLFRNATGFCPTMEKLKNSYFMLPCHMGVRIQDAELIANTLWPR